MVRAKAAWGTGTVVLILVEAIVRLGQVTLDALPTASGPVLAGTALWVAGNLYAEGYRGFQKRFVPAALDRAFDAEHLSPLRVALAPLQVLGLIWCSGPALRRGWVLLVTLVTLVLVVRQLPQPWRGAIDAGVVAGLSWGTAALVLGFARRWARPTPAASVVPGR